MTREDKQLRFEDIYDLIKGCFLNDNQKDEWGRISRKFSADAKRKLHRWGEDRNIEWDNGYINSNDKVERNPTITIGKDFIIELILKEN